LQFALLPSEYDNTDALRSLRRSKKEPRSDGEVRSGKARKKAKAKKVRKKARGRPQ